LNPRPAILTVLILLGLVGIFLNMMMVISPVVRGVAFWFPTYLSISTVSSAIFLGGLWFLKRWGLWGYTAVFACNQAVFLGLHRWNAAALLLSLSITLAGWFYLKIMK